MRVEQVELTRDASSATDARAFVDRFLRKAGAPSAERDDILLALNEAVANAFRYGGDDVRIIVACEQTEDRFVLTISDNGPGFQFRPEMQELPDPLSSSGRGFFLMDRLMDDMSVKSGPRGTTITLVRRSAVLTDA